MFGWLLRATVITVIRDCCWVWFYFGGVLAGLVLICLLALLVAFCVMFIMVSGLRVTCCFTLEFCCIV